MYSLEKSPLKKYPHPEIIFPEICLQNIEIFLRGIYNWMVYSLGSILLIDFL
jgi:hypothetical protein